MFREKKWLVQQGLYASSRDDTCYIIGMVYDDVLKSNKVITQAIQIKIESLRMYLDNHRELIGNKDYSIALTKSIIKRMQESFGFKIENVKEIKSKTVTKITKTTIKDDSWKTHGGIYGIYLNNELVYIGSTTCFSKRFSAHERGIFEKPEQHVHHELNKYIHLPQYQISIKVLIDTTIEQNHSFTDKELRAMEYGLIKMYQPKFNRAGITTPFYVTNK